MLAYRLATLILNNWPAFDHLSFCKQTNRNESENGSLRLSTLSNDSPNNRHPEPQLIKPETEVV